MLDRHGAGAARHQRRAFRRGGTRARPAGRQAGAAGLRRSPGVPQARPVRRHAAAAVDPLARAADAKPLRPAAGLETGAARPPGRLRADPFPLGARGASGGAGFQADRRAPGPPHSQPHRSRLDPPLARSHERLGRAARAAAGLGLDRGLGQPGPICPATRLCGRPGRGDSQRRARAAADTRPRRDRHDLDLGHDRPVPAAKRNRGPAARLGPAAVARPGRPPPRRGRL